MPIDLDTIRRQIVARLRTQLRTPSNTSGVFEFVGDIRGEPSVDRGDFEAEGLDRSASAVVQLESEKTDSRKSVTLLRGGSSEHVTTSTWRVFVSVKEPRGASEEWGGATSTPGMLDLVSEVKALLTGFRVVQTFALLSVVVTGTPDTAVTWPASTRLVRDDVEYTPTTTGAALDSDGNATIACTCSTLGALGNQTLGTVLTWSTTPADLNATARVAAVTTRGCSGLWRGETLRFVDDTHRGTRVGQIAVRMLRFTATHVLSQTSNPQPAAHDISLAGDVNLVSPIDAPDDPENPVDQIEATPEQ